jgi:hypothetical protein
MQIIFKRRVTCKTRRRNEKLAALLETELLPAVPIVVSDGETTTPWDPDLQAAATRGVPNKCVLICFNYLVDFCKWLL